MDLKTLQQTDPWEWPEEARDFLLAALRDGGAPEADRLLAAELAGDFTVIDDELAQELLAVAGSAGAPDALRSAASISLGPVLQYCHEEGVGEEGFEDEEMPIAEDTFRQIQTSLQAIFRNPDVPDEVRRRVLEGSVRAPEEWHQAAVREAYAGGDAAWRLTAVFCMSHVRGFEAEILEALGSGDPDLRYEAVCAAGAWAVEDAWPSIAPLLAPKTPKPLLLAAIEAAAFVSPGEAPKRLRRLLRSRDEDVVGAVHEALAMAESFEELEGEGEEDDFQGTWH